MNAPPTKNQLLSSSTRVAAPLRIGRPNLERWRRLMKKAFAVLFALSLASTLFAQADAPRHERQPMDDDGIGAETLKKFPINPGGDGLIRAMVDEEDALPIPRNLRYGGGLGRQRQLARHDDPVVPQPARYELALFDADALLRQRVHPDHEPRGLAARLVRHHEPAAVERQRDRLRRAVRGQALRLGARHEHEHGVRSLPAEVRPGHVDPRLLVRRP